MRKKQLKEIINEIFDEDLYSNGVLCDKVNSGVMCSNDEDCRECFIELLWDKMK